MHFNLQFNDIILPLEEENKKKKKTTCIWLRGNFSAREWAIKVELKYLSIKKILKYNKRSKFIHILMNLNKCVVNLSEGA